MTVTPPLRRPAGGKGSPAGREDKTKTKKQLGQTELNPAVLCCTIPLFKKYTDAMNMNNGDAHKKLFKKTNYCSTGMNAAINR